MSRILFLTLIILTSLNAAAGEQGKDYLFEDDAPSMNTRWYDLSRNSEDSLRVVLKYLKKSKSGKALLAKAIAKGEQSGETVFDIIKGGNKSITDTTLIRKFAAENPQEVAYETKSIVYLDKNLSRIDREDLIPFQ